MSEQSWRDSVERALAHLKKRLDQKDEHNLQNIMIAFRDRASVLALRSLVFELAEHCKVDTDHIHRTYESLRLYHLDQSLQMAEEGNQGIAAEMDDRTSQEMWTGDEIPTLF